MNQKLKDNLYVFSIPATYITLLLYNWYLANYVFMDELNPEKQEEELSQHFMESCENNLWLMVTLSVILNYWIAEIFIIIIANIF